VFTLLPSGLRFDCLQCPIAWRSHSQGHWLLTSATLWGEISHHRPE
jgi:hypothetical protein